MRSRQVNSVKAFLSPRFVAFSSSVLILFFFFRYLKYNFILILNEKEWE